MTSRVVGHVHFPVHRRLVLLRHGQTEWNATGRAQGQADVPLDEVGHEQAAVAAERLAVLQPAFVWSSDLSRARQTAEAVARRSGLEVRTDPRLREYDIGVRSGLTLDEFERQRPDLHAKLVAGENFEGDGEDHEDVDARMLPAVHEAMEALGQGEAGIIVSHGAALRTVTCALFGIPLESREMLSGMSNCAWTLLADRQRVGWQILEYNATRLPEGMTVSSDPRDNADDRPA